MKKENITDNERNLNFLEEKYFYLIEDLINTNSNNVYLVIQKARKDILFKDEIYVYFFLNILSKSKPENCISVLLKHEVFGLDINFVNETFNNLLSLISDNEFMKMFEKNTKELFKDLDEKDIFINPSFYKKLNFFLSIDGLSEDELYEIIKRNNIKRQANALDSSLANKADAEIFKI